MYFMTAAERSSTAIIIYYSTFAEDYDRHLGITQSFRDRNRLKRLEAQKGRRRCMEQIQDRVSEVIPELISCGGILVAKCL
jgi:hypothetical protein